MDGPENLDPNPGPPVCFAAVVSNTSDMPAHLTVSYQNSVLDIEAFARVPFGNGPGLVLNPYDPLQGLGPGEVALLFLSGRSEGTGDDERGVPCPVASAVPDAALDGTGVGASFRITSDVPVVASQIKPYGGGRAAATGASLLLPTSVWGTEYIAVQTSAAASGLPSLNIIASEDDTVVTITSSSAIDGSADVPGTQPGQALQLALQQGQHLQLTQPVELTGSIITASRPIGLMAGHECMNVPVGTGFCDHGEQMVPPVSALGRRYAGVMYRPRVAAETSTFWRIIGVTDQTELTYSTDVGGPTTIHRGESIIFRSGTPFEVSSQDDKHPFMMFSYMTGSMFYAENFGDPDFVLAVPPEQYLQDYVFFTDPTYSETNIVVTRQRHADGGFKEVALECAGALRGWTAITNDLEYTRHDLSTGPFASVGLCSNGRHRITSDAPFGVTVWGWGTIAARTPNVSYGYPAGMDARKLNAVILR